MEDSADPSQDLPSPRKKRKLDRDDTMGPPKFVSGRITRQSVAATVSESASPSKLSVRRVKLIVRPPEPVYSHHLQRPPPAKYGSSMASYLSSYFTYGDQDVSEDEIEKEVAQSTTFWANVNRLKHEGRLVFLSYLDGIDPNTGRYVRGSTPEPRRVPDAWDRVVQDIEKGCVRPVNGAAVAGQVASKVLGYWEARGLVGIGGSPEKVVAKVPLVKGKRKDLELMRVKKLAKHMAGMVMDRWKQAVMHVRDEDRRRLAEEEKRRGMEHLAAIVDQSGRILEVQQAELTREFSYSISRSSRSVTRSVASQSGDEEEQNDSDDETETHDSDDEMDTGHLLGDISLDQFARSSSVESIRMDHNSPAPTVTGDHHLAAGDASVEISDIPSHPVSSPEEAPQTPGPGSDEHPSPMIADHLGHADYPLGRSPPPVSQTSVMVPAKEPISVSHAPNGLDSRQSPSDGMIAESVGDTPALDGPQDDRRDNEPSIVDLEQQAALELRSAMQNIPVPDLETGGDEDDVEMDASIPSYLHPYAVAPVEWDPQAKVRAPPLLRGVLRPYQQAGLEWLASLHTSNMNGILADEMGLGKTIQTISLLAHLACDRGIWGPHLIIVPTSVLLNWEMEFKKFLPGFKVLSYHGNPKQRKELRQGWFNKYNFNVCVTSYTLAARDQNTFKRKPWYYMILDEAHMIKNFKSQRWNILLMFASRRRLLLTGTPLQNNLTELWALLQFLMSGSRFANLKEFSDWFSNPLEKAIEMGTALDDENQQTVAKLHTVLRPYLLRRLKRDVEKELPSKFEHLVMCPLSKRQRFLYDEFMSRADTRYDLQSGVYQKIANILMQLRKVVNHPDLFEVRPIKTSFAMQRSAIADFEIKELLIRRRMLEGQEESLDLDLLRLRVVQPDPPSHLVSRSTTLLNATGHGRLHWEDPGEAPPHDTRNIAGYRKYRAWQQRVEDISKQKHKAYINNLRCHRDPEFVSEGVAIMRSFYQPLCPLEVVDRRRDYLTRVDAVHATIKSYATRTEEMSGLIDRFSFVTPTAVARDLSNIVLSGVEGPIMEKAYDPAFDASLHRSSVKLQIAFPDPSLLQYDCGKLQELARLLRERKAGGHRVLIFTQMTRVLDILETFLNLHGYLYLRLDGSTKIEDRQYITERFNSDARVFCFIASSRSGGVGINLTGADTVIFYDSDFNPQMDRQCEDRAHRIGQIRDVHIYRFISEHTVEEALLRKANQKRSLDDLVIQKGEFDWRTLLRDDHETALTRALGEFEDVEDARAAVEAAKEEVEIVGADEVDLTGDAVGDEGDDEQQPILEASAAPDVDGPADEEDEEGEEDGGTTVEYMLAFIRYDMDYFNTWSV
ncbi:hypothetical protein EUX98_g6363 [Antrodiella citrinella]|uniref:Helicase SWR1 n=1 Tax=Antrodiella citrinella TaxID=2447956 RepID=A0A4S4MRV2_9APHY|nr:hypothetical protein EUX98_g6363 [Antrodiella citrinella]